MAGSLKQAVEVPNLMTNTILLVFLLGFKPGGGDKLANFLSRGVETDHHE